MKIYIIIIQFIFIQQFFFAAKVTTYNKPAEKHIVKSVTPAVSDSIKKVINIKRMQVIGTFPNIYPESKSIIKSMAEPEVTGFFETACVNNKKSNNIN